MAFRPMKWGKNETWGTGKKLLKVNDMTENLF